MWTLVVHGSEQEMYLEKRVNLGDWARIWPQKSAPDLLRSNPYLGDPVLSLSLQSAECTGVTRSGGQRNVPPLQ